MKFKFEKGNHSVYNMSYHFIQCVKYRRKVLCNEQVCYDLKKKTASLINKYGMRLVELGIDKDHIHIMFSSKPESNLIKFINNWKSSTSKYLRNKYPWIKNQLKNSLWSRSYCLRSIGNVDFETIEWYVRNQGKNEKEKRIKRKERTG